MKRRFRIPSLVFYGLTTLMASVIICCFASALSWVGKSFAGFTIYPPPYVASLGSRDWPGYKAGLRYLDRIVSIDGLSIRVGQDVIDAVRQKQPGTPVRYVFESKGEIHETTVSVATFDMGDFLSVSFTTLLCGLLLYILGVIVYLLKPNIASSWVFYCLCFTLGTYVISSFDSQSSYLLLRFHILNLCLFPATFFHLGLIFPDRKRILSRWPQLEYFIYLPALILFLLFQVYLSSFQEGLTSPYLSWLPGWQSLSLAARIFALFCAVSLLLSLFHSVYKASTVMARQRARMILFGVAVAFIPPGIAMGAVNFLKVVIPWNLLVFFVIFFPASIAYSIVRHNLFDADTIIRRTVGYAVVTAVVVGVYVGVSLLLNVFIGQSQLAQSRSFPILFTLAVILIFNPLRDRIQALVDRLFFRKEYDYGAIVEKVSGAMTSLLDLPQILKRLVQTFMDDMFIDTSSVMLLTPDGSQYKVYMAEGEKKQDVEGKAFKRENPLFEIIEKEKNELTKYDVFEDPKYSDVSASSVSDFDALQASLMVPLVYQDQVIGSMNLGEKKSGKPFNREDIDLLRTLAHQGAVAIENARLFQENLEKQRMEEELNIARDLQTSMLPADCPQIKGFEIAAYSLAAREVGGDFYDFIDMGEDKAGMVIGDVTGKSVSGALVMSASRTLFRTLSEDESGVRNSMMRANQRLKKDVKTGMFVALLYAVLNAQDQTLTLCSAGQTLPIHMSATTGKAVLVETRGDTFPLGILGDSEYEETQLKLQPGDKVVLYTDGIVEAMNEKEEIFGFERLVEVVQGARSAAADLLLKEILDRVNAFTGGAAQHDDLTLIVVSLDQKVE